MQNITVGAKFWIFSKKLEASAVNDVAKVSASVPEGKYDVSIYGLAKGSAVGIEAKARAGIKLDSSGVYSISYFTFDASKVAYVTRSTYGPFSVLSSVSGNKVSVTGFLTNQ